MEQEQGSPGEETLFAARLHPHRSLSPQGFRWLMIGTGLAGLLVTLPFVFLGAWPILGFMGLDVLAIYAAFRWNFRDARAYEDLHLTPLELRLAKVTPSGARAEWCFNPLWVRLERRESEDFGLESLAVAARERRVEIATYLDPPRKADFAKDFGAALALARRGPHFS